MENHNIRGAGGARRDGPWSAAFLLTAACSVGSLMAAHAPADEVVFAVLKDDDRIGQHSLTFERRGDDLHVTIKIDIEVGFAFLTFYEYRHQNREVWRDGRLVSLSAWTEDNGSRHTVTARATPDSLEVEGTEGTFTAPADIIPTSYWNPATVEQSRLLDTQRGRLLDVTVKSLGEDSVPIDETKIPARKYGVSGDLDVELWYTPAGEWARIAFEVRDTAIDYAPVSDWADRLRKSY